jgi:hypothetical protein
VEANAVGEIVAANDGEGEGDRGRVIGDDGKMEANSNVVVGRVVPGADDGNEANSDVDEKESLLVLFFRDTPSVMPIAAAAISTSATAISTQVFAMGAVFHTK